MKHTFRAQTQQQQPNELRKRSMHKQTNTKLTSVNKSCKSVIGADEAGNTCIGSDGSSVEEDEAAEADEEVAAADDAAMADEAAELLELSMSDENGMVMHCGQTISDLNVPARAAPERETQRETRREKGRGRER